MRSKGKPICAFIHMTSKFYCVIGGKEILDLQFTDGIFNIS